MNRALDVGAGFSLMFILILIALASVLGVMAAAGCWVWRFFA